MKGRQLVIIAAVAVAALATGGWLLQRDTAPSATVYQQARLFDDILAHVADYYVDSIDESKLYGMAIDGLLDQLHDPYSVYLKPDDFHELSEQISGDYGGLGFQFEVRDNFVAVVAPLPETPAERAGLQSGDEITALDGQATAGWKNDDVFKKMRGPAGTTVTLTVRRPGVDQPLTFKITRAKIHVRSVGIVMMLDDKVGYIAMSPVSDSSAAEVAQAVDSLSRAGMKSLIFDLRGNPGGSLTQGVGVTDLFLNPGQAVVATKGRAPNSNAEYRDDRAQRWPNLPIVVLVNGFTASAAEIISGALQDHDRALVVGTPTWGKGLVQSVWQLTPETALKLTTARWYTPSGRTIQRASKSEEDQAAQVMAAARGHDSIPLDTTLVYRTDAGRKEYGGGGIRPDLFVTADTFSTAEQAFNKAIGAKAPIYADVLSGYAVDTKMKHQVSGADFPVTDAMEADVLQRLKARGLTFPPGVVEGARTLFRQEIGYEVARYAFGRIGEFHRRVGDDRQVQEALDLARRARSPQDLLTLAAGSASKPGR
ncbi:MAG TPA: S41 family peptidase [Gemmatimonadales bacterium]|nr:S41 family peptidase [Gemmatimonadales bacterium]